MSINAIEKFASLANGDAWLAHPEAALWTRRSG